MMSPDDEALLGLADLVVPGLLDYALEGDRGDQVHCANGNWPCHRDHELLTPARGSSQPIPERGPTSVSESPNKG